MNENQEKKCLECDNYTITHETIDNEFTYKCGLSKAKRDKCLRGAEDYFKEV